MSPTRRDVLRSVAGVAVALPLATLPQVAAAADDLPVIAEPAHWNTVQTDYSDESIGTLPDRAWDAHAFVFTQEDDSGRYTQRRLTLVGYVDGSVRLCFSSADVFDRLNVGDGRTAVHLAPDLGAEVWRGLLATSEDDPMPTAPMPPGEPVPWGEEKTKRYYRQQQRLIRMGRYADREDAIEGNPGVHRWFNPTPAT